MRLISRMAVGVVLALAGVVVCESQALAATQCNPSPPDQCSFGRNLRGWNAGVFTGVAVVDQIWYSPAVNRDPDNWEILEHGVVDVIPQVVAGLPSWPDGYTDYVQCRIQGLLEGTTCRMMEINPGLECALDGADWGEISASVYCLLSEDLDGLGDVAPWFIRPPVGLCGDEFQSWCEDVYRYVATNGDDPLNDEHVDPPWTPWPPYGDPECLAYTQDPFATVFEHSVTIDCTYDLPPPPQDPQ